MPGIEQHIPVKLIYLEWGLIGVGLAFITLPQVYQSYVLFGLIAMLGAFGLRWWRSGHFIPRTGLELPALLFLVSGGIAAWLAFDSAPALLQYTRLLAAVVAVSVAGALAIAVLALPVPAPTHAPEAAANIASTGVGNPMVCPPP